MNNEKLIKLPKQVEELTSQMDNIDQKKANKDSIFNMSNMGQDVKEAMTGGSVAVVGKHSVGNDNVIPNSITTEKLKGITVKKNLVDKKSFIDNLTINTSGGEEVNSIFKSTGFIKLDENTTYSRVFSQVALYNSSFVFTRMASASFTTNVGEIYMRVTIVNENIDKVQIEKGQQTPYEKYKFSFESLRINEENLEEVKFNPCNLKGLVPKKNLINIYDVYDNTLIDRTNGNIVVNNSCFTTDFIEVFPNTAYSKTQFDVIFYNEQKQFILNNISGNSFTTPSNCKYVRISVLKPNKYTCQLELGTVNTEYEPYLLVLPKGRAPIELNNNNIKKDIIINLPKYIYILKGTESNKEQFNIYFKNIILGIDNPRVNVICNYGKQLSECWRFESVNSKYPIPTAPFTLRLDVVDEYNNILKSATTTIELLDKVLKPNVNLLPIGDSMTEGGYYVQNLIDKLGLTTLGTRCKEGLLNAREGRSGWTINQYVNSINMKGLDSPFVFPTNVAGDKYKGNTYFWSKVINDSANYVYDGFQKIAKGWNDSGNYLYDNNGYYKNPSINDVMCNPLLDVGKQWIQWDGSAWVTMPTQPTTFEFNFAKYMQMYSSAFSKVPNVISILLGANDFQFVGSIANLDNFITNLNKIINNIKSYKGDMKFIINLPIICGKQDGWNITLSNKNTYDTNIKLACDRILKEYSDKTNENIYISPMVISIDEDTAFSYISETKNIYTTDTVNRVKDSIHPNQEVGYKQMADSLCGVIEKLF